MNITYVTRTGKYILKIKGFDFTPQYATRLEAIAHGCRLIAYYQSLNASPCQK